MVRPRVMVSRMGLPGDGIDLLARHCDLTVWRGAEPPTADQLRRLVYDCDAALVLGSDRIDGAFLDAAWRGIRVVALASMGHDAVDKQAAAERGVVVTNTPDVLAETTADLTMALILAARRRIWSAGTAMRAGGWTSFRMDEFLGLDVHGATLGLLGYGQIGRAVARRATGFGMQVRHYSRSAMSDGWSTAVGFEELLACSDILSVHVPLTSDTQGMIGARELALMKPTATLVNTARGGVVDEQALLAALRSEELHSAGLDVMADEPRSDIDSELFTQQRLVLLPHIGSATEVTRANMVSLAARNILAVLDGQDPITPVTARVG